MAYEEGEAFAKIHNLLFLETSAKSGFNIEEVFKEATHKILGEQQGNSPIDEEQKIKLDKKPNDSEQGWSLWTYC